MEEEFDYTNVPVASMDDFYTPDKEEEELDEFGNPVNTDPAKGFFGQLFGEDIERNETYEEREARQADEIEAKTQETLSDQYVIDDSTGQVKINPETGQPELKELSSGDKIVNSIFKNVANSFQQFLPNLTVASNKIYRGIFGDEAVESWLKNENIPEFFKEGLSEKDLDEAIQQSKLEEAEMGEVGSITEGLKLLGKGEIMKGSGELVAGIVNGITSIGSSAAINTLTLGGGLIPDMIGRSYIDYNEEVAKQKGKTLSDLIRDGEDDITTAATVGTVSGLLERAGLKGAGRLMTKKLTGAGLGKTMTSVLLSGNKEGLTELAQTGLDAVNIASAKDENKTEAFVDAVLSQEGLESYLQGFVGGGLMRGSGNDPISKSLDSKKNIKFKKATAALRGPAETVLQNQALQSIAELRKTLATTTDPQVKKEIKKGIAIQEAKIIDITLKAQAKAAKLTDKEIDQIAVIQDEVDIISNGVTELDKKLADGVINTEQRNAAVKTYEEQFKTKQEELSTISNASKTRIQPKSKTQQFREDESLRLVDLYNDLDRAIVNGDPDLESEINSKIVKAEQAVQTIDGIVAEDSIVLSEQAQSLYDANGIKALNSIVETQEGTIRSVAIKKLNSVPQFRRYDGDVDALASELRYGPEGVARLVETYKPESGVPIAAYIAQQLNKRVERAATKVLSQDNNVDFNSTEAANLLVEEENDFEVKIGSKFLADQLKLPMAIIDKAKKIIPVGLQKAVNELQKNKELTAKKRQALSKQAIDSIYDGQLVKDIKAEFGKNTKTKEDFSNYLNRNYKPLATAFLAQKAGQKGTGISKQWSMFAPTRSEFVDYYEGKDIPLDRKSRKSVISDRKAALAEAVSTQIAEDVRAEYLLANPIEASEINKAANKDVSSEKTIIIAKSKLNNQSFENTIAAFKFEQFQKSLEKTKEDFAENSLDWKKLLENEGIEDFNLNNEERVQTFLKLLKSTGLTKLLPASFFRQFNGTTDPSSVMRGGIVFYQLKNGGEVEAVTKINNKGEEVSTYPPEYGKNGKGKFKNSLLRTRRGHVFFKSAPDADAWIAENGPFAAESELYKDLFTPTSYDKIVNGRREIKLENDFKNPEFKKQQENKLKALKQIFNIFEDFIAKDPENNNKPSTQAQRKAVIGGLLKSSSGWQGHFMRLASPVKFTSKGKMFDYSKNPKGKALFTEEHTLPASAVAKFLFRQAINGKVNDNFNLIEKNYFQGALLNVNDDKLAGNGPDGRRFSYKSKTPEGWMLTDSIWARYFNANVNNVNGGIDANSIVLSNGQTVAEFFGAGLDGINSNPDLIKAQQKVVTEKADPTERIIGKAKDKVYNEKADSEKTGDQAAEGLAAILEANWNKNGDQDFEIVTDKARIKEVLAEEEVVGDDADNAMKNNLGFQILGTSKIFVDLTGKDALNTTIHESGHVWNQVIFNSAPEVWNNIISRVKETGLFDVVFNKIKNDPAYAGLIENYNNGDTFGLENEIFARILEDYGAKALGTNKNTLAQIKDIISKYMTELANMLGFDPTTKNFGDLTLDQMIDLAVSEVVSGDPLSNFSKLKDSEGKTWYKKSRSNVDPEYRSSINPEYQGLKALEKFYKESKNLIEAIKKSYSTVKNIMTFEEWSDFVAKTTSEVQIGKTPSEKALLIAKENAAQNEAARLKKIKALKESDNYTEEDQNKTSEELDKKLEEVQNKAIEKEKAKAEGQGEGLNRNFRKILNSITGRLGKPSRWFIPPNAEDIKGLLYAFLPGGEAGLKAKKFFQSTILEPYSRGVAAAEAEILAKTKQFAEIMKSFKSDLKEVVDGTPYSKGQAIKVYNWIKNGVEVDIEKQSYIDALVSAVENDPELKALADQIEQNFPIEYKSTWRNDTTINKSIYDSINSGTRAKHLETFAENVDNIFNKDNMQEIENLYGKKFRQALQNSLQRMKTGRNRVSTDAQSNAFLNWINRAVATTMFVNTRSAVLQLLSSLNFIGKANNNIFQATSAMFSSDWKKDFNTLWNSDYLKNRREGAKFDVLADEMSEGDVTGLNKILKFGFLPTRMSDSFAIALGGAAFYRNTLKTLIEGGMSEADAKKAAMQKWIETAEESQQSSDPSKISEIQSSTIGKVIYAFANTPFQYARIVKRKLQDVVSGRSAAEGGGNKVRQDLQSVLYYSVGQAMLFNALQTALFAVAFEDDEDEKEKLMDEKTILSVERALTSYAKSLGNPGAVAGAIYSVIAEANEQQEKYGKIDNPYKIALEATAISPPLNTKLKDIVAIGNIYKYNEKEIKNDPFKLSPDNKALEIVGNAASFGGIPLDRVIRKAQNLSAMANEESEAWQKLFLALGWSKWELGLNQKKKFALDLSLDLDLDLDLDLGPLKKSLPKGVAGRANKDGTIEVDSNLPPEQKKAVIKHEKHHQKEIKSGKLDYDDNFVYYNKQKYPRVNGKIEYKGKMHIEGGTKLPWEIAANNAERSNIK